jgi:hypothetical protein
MIIKIHIGLTKRLLHDDVKKILGRLLRKYIQYSVHGFLQFGGKLRKLSLESRPLRSQEESSLIFWS